MGSFDRFRSRKPAVDPVAGGVDGCFDVLDVDGRLVRYVPDDFDEIWTTTDEREAGRHVTIGWLLLDEVVGPGDGPHQVEFVQRSVHTGSDTAGYSLHEVPVDIGPADATTYVLGYLKPGRVGSRIG